MKARSRPVGPDYWIQGGQWLVPQLAENDWLVLPWVALVFVVNLAM